MFLIEKENLFLTVPIDIYTATNGGSIEVPSPDGKKLELASLQAPKMVRNLDLGEKECLFYKQEVLEICM